MCIAALLIIGKTWMQPRHPSVGEWINKLWYNQTMEYYSAIKKKCAIESQKDIEGKKRYGGYLSAYC